MKEIEKPQYSFEASPDALVFEFDSVSENKIIRKVVIYEEIEGYDDLFQLGFGDLTLAVPSRQHNINKTSAFFIA